MKIKDIKIGNKIIGPGHKPFIIAEMSGNHNQSLERALELVDAAADAGVDALKLQTYTADTMTLDVHEGEFFISNPDNLWEGQSLYKLYQEAYTPWEWHEEIFARCQERGIIGFSSPFDESAVEFLEDLDVPAYKIASFENIDLPLLARVAQTKKPIIFSSGLASISELDEAMRTLRDNGAEGIILLKCTSTYPASPKNSNLATIAHMRELFNCQVGLSDHSMGIGVSVAAVAMGATVIEKHFTIDRADGGVDADFSMEVHEMKELVIETERAWQSLGEVYYGPTEDERPSLEHRRSLYIAQDMQAGDILTRENLRSIRPGLGLEPKYLDILLGKKVKMDVKKGSPMSWDLI